MYVVPENENNGPSSEIGNSIANEGIVVNRELSSADSIENVVTGEINEVAVPAEEVQHGNEQNGVEEEDRDINGQNDGEEVNRGDGEEANQGETDSENGNGINGFPVWALHRHTSATNRLIYKHSLVCHQSFSADEDICITCFSKL